MTVEWLLRRSREVLARVVDEGSVRVSDLEGSLPVGWGVYAVVRYLLDAGLVERPLWYGHLSKEPALAWIVLEATEAGERFALDGAECADGVEGDAVSALEVARAHVSAVEGQKRWAWGALRAKALSAMEAELGTAAGAGVDGA